MNPTFELAPGLTISRIITGLWQIADMERKHGVLDPEKTALHMAPYVEAGLTTFDMADHYGSSEIIAGTFKNTHPAGQRTQLFTKWVPEPGKITREDVHQAVQKALDRMQQSKIDLMQFHAWHYPDSSWLDGLFYLKELYEQDLVRRIGVTNFDAAHLGVACASGIPITSNQVCHSLIDRRAQGNMQKVCSHYNVKLLVFGTLAGGFLTDKWLGKKEPTQDDLETWSEMKYKRFIDEAGGWEPYQHLLKAVKKVADRHNASIANISSRMMFENPHVAAVIVGARLGKSEHIEDNKKILDIHLTQDDIKDIQTAQNALKPIPGDCGDEYRKPPFLTASGDLSHHLDSIPKAYSPVTTGENREQVFSGTVWEEMAGFSRAVRDGNRIYISGTTATHGQLKIGGIDVSAQTHFIIDKIEGTLEAFGCSLKDVVRTRIFVNDLDDWEDAARAHGERFKGINPANTLVEARLVGEGYLVEMEAEATIKSTR